MQNLKKFILINVVILVVGCGGGASGNNHSNLQDEESIEQDVNIFGINIKHSNKVYFETDNNIYDMEIKYLDSHVTNGQPHDSKDGFSSKYDTSGGHKLTVEFNAGRSGSKEVSDSLYNSYLNNNPAIGTNLVKSKFPNALNFYIVANFYINGSPIVDDSNSIAKIYLAQGSQSGIFNNWWFITSGKIVKIKGLPYLLVTTMNRDQYLIYPRNGSFHGLNEIANDTASNVDLTDEDAGYVALGYAAGRIVSGMIDGSLSNNVFNVKKIIKIHKRDDYINSTF